MNWEWILSVIGIVLFCVAFYAYLSEPVGKAFDDADDAGFILRRKVYERTEPIPMMMQPEPLYPYEGFPQEPDPITGVMYGFPKNLLDTFPVSVTIGDAPKLPKKPRKSAKKAVKKVAKKKTAKKKPNSKSLQ